MDPTLFDGLYIAQNKDLCDAYMGRYPVVSISLKGVDADSYEKARAQLIRIINKEARRHRALLEDEKMDAIDRELFVQFLDRQMEDDTITSSLQELTELLAIHFSQKVVVLIDEYDVPLAKAYENGYYDEMVLLLRNMFGNVLKSNDSLAFAVLTGCLRIAKESIFTGTNNFVSDTIADSRFNEYFGFTQKEVDQILEDAEITELAPIIKSWYDGYHFGNFDVYCPWDVMNYLRDLQYDPQILPRSYWKNTSDVVVLDSRNGRVAVFEAKYSKTLEHMESDCEKAVRQINDRMYAEEFADNYDEVFCYGISFYKKRCIVLRK